MGVIKGTSVIVGVIPFTELYERLLNLGRIDSPNNTDYAKGIINDSYQRSLPRAEDWNGSCYGWRNDSHWDRNDIHISDDG